MTSGNPRRLVVLRHAKSAWPDVPDSERPLAPRGRRDAPAAGRWLREADACDGAKPAGQGGDQARQLGFEVTGAWPPRAVEQPIRLEVVSILRTAAPGTTG